jgi:hypothetical protein
LTEHGIVRVEQAPEAAMADRHGLGLTARTVLSQAESDLRQGLEHTISAAAKADLHAFARMKAGVETMVTERVLNANALNEVFSSSAEADALARVLMSP